LDREGAVKILKMALLLAQATALFGQYHYFLSDTFSSIDESKWSVYYPDAVVTSQGLAPSAAVLISRLGNGYFSEEEVKTTIVLDQDGGAKATHYLRAFGPPDNFTYYTVDTVAGWPSPGQCSYWLYKRYAQIELKQTGRGSCHDGSTIRTMVRSLPGVDAFIEIYFDDELIDSFTDYVGLQFGYSGIGVGGGWVSRIDIGALEHVAPNPVNPATIGKSVWANRVDFQWQAATDDPNGIGVSRYAIYKNGAFISAQTGLSYSDQTLIPGVTYTYTLYVIDFHGNWSTGTSFNVTTQGNHPNFVIPTPPARTGIRPTGSYWGAGSEQIDTLSGNLNWVLPLLKAQSRGGWGVGFSLNYNSQVWRQDSGGTWNLGIDIGYGYGWRLMAGSVVPYWSDPYTITHYIYTDSTGADYKLNVNTNGIWTSTEGNYVSYDPAGPKLIFPDGTVWIMGCESGGNEPDIGVRYPTLMQDTNGNYIVIYYQAGRGASPGNTSARIYAIDDVRSRPDWYPYPNPTPYTYVFTYNSDPTPHLTAITNYIGTDETYTFTHAFNQTVSSPFGYDPNSSVAASLLLKVSNAGTIDHSFEYSGGSGELTRAVLPYGGSLRWAYNNFSLSGKTIREVQYRYLSKASGAAETQYSLSRNASDSNLGWHSGATLADPAGALRNWTFTTAPNIWNDGLLASFSQQAGVGQAILRKQDFTWTQDPMGNPYIGAVVTTLDPGAAYQKQSKTTQTLDAHGNLTSNSIYDFGNLSTPARTYSTGYLTGAQYAARNIWNRPVWTSVTNGSQSVQLSSAGYDNYECSGIYSLTTVTGPRLHDPNYAINFIYRGNVTTSSTLSDNACLKYDITGFVTGSVGSRGTMSMTNSAATNFAAPVAITANNYTTTLAYNGFLAVTSATGQNGETAGTTYGAGRPTSVTSPHGAVTSFGYSNNPPRIYQSTTNGPSSTTSLDGFGRPIRVETGNGIVDTEYDSCACSPVGKMKRTSQPYAPGAQTIYWTTYTYDGLGRTVSTVAPDGATTTYLYQGNATTITDPAGKWKKYVTDAMGNLIQVIEPNPGNN
jgi:hypothetical protein